MKSPVRDLQIFSLGGIIFVGLLVIGLRLWFVQVRMRAYYRREISGKQRSACEFLRFVEKFAHPEELEFLLR
jgi:hypothetical protein